MPDDRRPRPETLCARPSNPPASVSSPLVPPLALSVVYEIDGLDQVDALYEGRAPGYIYARDGHPNADALAAKIAALEGAEAALACGSGMGAEAAAMLALLGQGDRVALAEELYGRTARLAAELGRFGVEIDLFDSTRPGSLREALGPRTRLAFVETLSNPLVRVADLPELAEVARSGGTKLVVDHTFAPLLCRPLELGAGLVVHSGTKLIGGHSDLTLGLLAGRKAEIERAGSVASTFGMTANPFECWLASRGIATLPIRSRRACETALEVAGRLESHPKVRASHYPGLCSHPDHRRASRLFKGGFGTIATIDLGGRAEADAFIKALRGRVPFAPSLGDVSTTLSHPATTSHRGQAPERWARQGITPGLVRISFGLEDAGDLWSEFSGALDGL